MYIHVHVSIHVYVCACVHTYACRCREMLPWYAPVVTMSCYLGVLALSFLLVALYIMNTVMVEKMHHTVTILQKAILQLVTMGISHSPSSVTSCKMKGYHKGTHVHTHTHTHTLHNTHTHTHTLHNTHTQYNTHTSDNSSVLYLVRSPVLQAPSIQEDLGEEDGAEKDQDHFRVHRVVAPVFLLQHAVPHVVLLLLTQLIPVHLVPIHVRHVWSVVMLCNGEEHT